MTVPGDEADPLRLPAFRRLLAGRVLGALARQILSVSVGWQVYERTGSALALGLIGLVLVIPVVALVVPAGLAADRFDRRIVAIVTYLGIAACGAALLLLTHFQAPVVWTYVVLLGCGVATAFSGPAISSITPNLVPPAAFARANAWTATTFELSAIGGPAIAGGVLTWAGFQTAYALVAIFAVGLAVAFAGLPAIRAAKSAPAASRSEELRAGLRFVLRSRLLLPAITLDLFAVLFGGAVALLPMFAKDVLHVGPSGLGWLRAAPSIGAAGMALITTRIPPFERPGRALLVAVAGFGLATLGFGLSRSYGWSLFFLALTGVCDNVSVVIRQTIAQMVTPDHLRGRVGAVHFVFIGLSNELGAFESGVAAWLLGPIGSVLLGGTMTLVVVALVAARWPFLWKIGSLAVLRPDEPPVPPFP